MKRPGALGASLFKKILIIVKIFWNVVYRGSRIFRVSDIFVARHFSSLFSPLSKQETFTVKHVARPPAGACRGNVQPPAGRAHTAGIRYGRRPAALARTHAGIRYGRRLAALFVVATF